jgi:hypothetical protein
MVFTPENTDDTEGLTKSKRVKEEKERKGN